MIIRICVFVFLLFVLSIKTIYAQEVEQYVRIETPQGSCIVRLFNETPNHRDNFLKLVSQKYFDQTFFHRVIKDFVAQGGDPDTLFKSPEKENRKIDLGQRINPEFRADLFHKKGALAAGRDDNPHQGSFVSQFYLVDGATYTDRELDAIEKQQGKDFKFTEVHRAVYRTQGGLPYLDHQYTVFGEVVQGVALVDVLTAIKTGGDEAPLSPVPMKIRVLTGKEIKLLKN